MRMIFIVRYEHNSGGRLLVETTGGGGGGGRGTQGSVMREQKKN